MSDEGFIIVCEGWVVSNMFTVLRFVIMTILLLLDIFMHSPSSGVVHQFLQTVYCLSGIQLVSLIHHTKAQFGNTAWLVANMLAESQCST